MGRADDVDNNASDADDCIGVVASETAAVELGCMASAAAAAAAAAAPATATERVSEAWDGAAGNDDGATVELEGAAEAVSVAEAGGTAAVVVGVRSLEVEMSEDAGATLPVVAGVVVEPAETLVLGRSAESPTPLLRLASPLESTVAAPAVSTSLGALVALAGVASTPPGVSMLSALSLASPMFLLLL